MPVRQALIRITELHIPLQSQAADSSPDLMEIIIDLL